MFVQMVKMQRWLHKKHIFERKNIFFLHISAKSSNFAAIFVNQHITILINTNNYEETFHCISSSADDQR